VAGNSPITVAFQRIWDLRRGVVPAHEALLRLPEDSRITGPQEAFDLAERLGLAVALDARARVSVLAAAKARGWEGLLFMNVHPDALADLDTGALTADLAVAGLEPEDVVLEVTEQGGLDHPEPIRTLKRAHELGFRLVLDDMGRSNAGLRALTVRHHQDRRRRRRQARHGPLIGGHRGRSYDIPRTDRGMDRGGGH
jgi:EAL domain-containing protein (putative c-di-GMP-specific phosphodiesterase class I)